MTLLIISILIITILLILGFSVIRDLLIKDYHSNVLNNSYNTEQTRYKINELNRISLKFRV